MQARAPPRGATKDDLYRVIGIENAYSTDNARDTWISPYQADLDAPEGDPRCAPPSPHVSFDDRVTRQTWQYDWLGNTTQTTDDASGFYDRSLGTVTTGPVAGAAYQLQSAEIAGTGGGRVDTKYDAAGNLVRMNLRRDGTCLGGPTCSARFDYQWDEVGRLVRARRWDTEQLSDVGDDLPDGDPAADLRYLYDAGDQRVLKTAVDGGDNENQSHTAYVFESLVGLEGANAETPKPGTPEADQAQKDFFSLTHPVRQRLQAHANAVGAQASGDAAPPERAEPGATDPPVLPPDLQTKSRAELEELLKKGPTEFWQNLGQNVMAIAAFLNTETPDAIRTDGSGSSNGVPGGGSSEATGGGWMQALYVAGAVASLGIGAKVADKALEIAKQVVKRAKQEMKLLQQVMAVGMVGGGGVPPAARGAPKTLPAPRTRGNPNPIGERGTFYVDSRGNVIPTPPGDRITGSPDGRFIQARDAAGNPTGVRIDGPHRPATHPDPRAQQPHGHVPGVTNPDGTPWLPINQ
ncbi:MAG: hypothetical protein JW751_21745 [Polyangiaceae bacterium]|nr:hypothetical protein [Polyangiaceae bacterium]